MYTGNGRTKEFPLPDGADGSVVLLTAEGGRAVRLAAEMYSVKNGAVVMDTAPPEGVTVSFDECDADAQSAAAMAAVCTVIYPDGTVRQIYDDPAEVLYECQIELDRVRGEIDRIRQIKTEITAAAAEAKETLNSRLLNYGAMTEQAVKAAANAVRDELCLRIRDEIAELRSLCEELRSEHEEARKYSKAAIIAADESSRAARSAFEESVSGTMGELAALKEAVRTAAAAAERHAEAAQSAALEAGRRVIDEMRPRAEVLMEELRGLRGAFERDVMMESRRRNSDREDMLRRMEHIKDDVERSARRMDNSAAAANVMYEKVSAAEDRTRRHADRTDAFQTAWNARIQREIAERNRRIEKDEA